MIYSLHIQEIGGVTVGDAQTEIVPLVGDWVTIPNAPGNYEVIRRKFRYDTKAKQIQEPKAEFPTVVLFVRKVAENQKWEAV